MKKISTLGFAVFFSVASFAAFSPNRLTVSAEGNTNIKVTIDGNRFEQPTTSSSITVENLQPGFHWVSIFRVTGKRFGMFGRRDGDDYRLVYTASVNIKPLFATSIAISRSGRTQVIEEPMRGIYDDRKWGNDPRDDHRYYDQRNDYGRNSGYSNIISDADFFAAERVMERENDNGRLLYAERLADNYYLNAEQVKELARFFSFDNCRLDFIKYAYNKTVDKSNFRVVCAAFVSNDGRNQVENFIKACK
jgi:hypothetical protein